MNLVHNALKFTKKGFVSVKIFSGKDEISNTKNEKLIKKRLSIEI